MSNHISRRLVMPALTALAVIGGLGAFSAVNSTPAMALCKYGTPNCVNPNPGHPTVPMNGGVQIPPSNWHDPECKYYGNCNTGLTQSPGTNTGRTGAGKIYTR